MLECRPEDLKKILELFGYKLHLQDAYNWSMTRGTEIPVIIPKSGEVVSIEALNSVFTRIGMVPRFSNLVPHTHR